MGADTLGPICALTADLLSRGRAGGTNSRYLLEPLLDGCAFRTPLVKIETNFVNVTPPPVFSELERSHDGMSGRAEVFGSVLILGGIATADVPTAQAQTKVHPPIALLQTLLTTSSARFDILDLIEMRAVGHCFTPVGCCTGTRT